MLKTHHLILPSLIFCLAGCGSIPSKAVAASTPVAYTGAINGPVNGPVYNAIPFYVRRGVPARVFIQETVVMLQVGNAAPVSLESIYPPLYKGWGRYYLKVGDFDRDGDKDLAVLQSVGHGGHDRCYSVYRFNPQTKTFRPRRSFDRCGI